MCYNAFDEVAFLRVISGIAKGRRLQAPKGLKTRPTADRVKEAVFNIISPFIGQARFLDLFAGSGGMGIEALAGVLSL